MDLARCLQTLQNPDARKVDDVKEALQGVQTLATTSGFGPAQIHDLVVTIVTVHRQGNAGEKPNRVQVRVSEELTKWLWPSHTVHARSVLTLLGPLMTFSHPMQAACLRWLTLVFDVVDGRVGGDGWKTAVFHVCFFLLDFDTVRPRCCYLLCRVTDRSLVTAHRVRHLLSLRRRVGKEREFNLVIRLFKSFNSGVVLRAHSSASLKFKNSDPAKMKRMNAVRMAHKQPALQFLAHASVLGDVVLVSKAQQGTLQLPPVVVPRSHTVSKATNTHCPPITALGGVQPALVWAKRERMAPPLPAQMVSCVHSTPLLHALQIFRSLSNETSEHAVRRLSNWLHMAVQGATARGDMAALGQALHVVLEVSVFFQEVPSCLESWLHNWLCGWDGTTHKHAILPLLPLLRPMAFEVLFWKFLKPIHALFVASGPVFKAEVVACVCDIVRAYARMDFEHTMYQHSQPSPHDHQLGPLTFTGAERGVDYPQCLHSLVVYAHTLCSFAMLAHPLHPLVHCHVLSLLAQTSRLWSVHSVPLMVAPPPGVVFTGVLASALSCSRTCALLASIKRELDALKAREGKESSLAFARLPSGLDHSSTTYLNSLNTQVCRALWLPNCKVVEHTWNFLSLEQDLVQALRTAHPSLGPLHTPLSLVSSLNFAVAKHTLARRLRAEKAPKDKMKARLLELVGERGYHGVREFVHTLVRSAS